MIMDWGQKKLEPYRIVPITFPPLTAPPISPVEYVPSEEWRKQFLKDLVELLAAAKKYDETNGEPDCELDSKKEKLKAIAEELGVEVVFP